MDEIIDAVLLIEPRNLVDSRILHRPLMQVLHQVFISLLFLASYCINTQEMGLFLRIIWIFIQVAGRRTVDTADRRFIDNETISIRST